MRLYSPVFRGIHLVSALLIFVLIPLGFYMQGVDEEQTLVTLYNLHKSLGVLVLGTILLRIYLRVKTVKSKTSTNHSRLERNLSFLTQWSLYPLLLIMPVSGWLMSNAAGIPVSFFGLFNLPDLVSKSDASLVIYQQIHFYVATAILALISLHVAGALKHHFIDQDNTLKRMSSNNLNAAGGVVIALVAVLFLISSTYLWIANSGENNDAHTGAHGAAHESAQSSVNDSSH